MPQEILPGSHPETPSSRYEDRRRGQQRSRNSCSLGAPSLEESTLGSSAASLKSARSYGRSTHVVADSSSQLISNTTSRKTFSIKPFLLHFNTAADLDENRVPATCHSCLKNVSHCSSTPQLTSMKTVCQLAVIFRISSTTLQLLLRLRLFPKMGSIFG